jgi:hypothetical protein
MEDLVNFLIESWEEEHAALDTCLIPMLMTWRVSVTISQVSANI